MEIISNYRVMWILVLFDLPTNTKKSKQIYSEFRKSLLKDGFIKLQFSVYKRHCLGEENALTHIKRIESKIPETGEVIILKLTDKQYSSMRFYNGKGERYVITNPLQLEIF